MAKKEEYKLSGAYQKEVDFVKEVVAKTEKVVYGALKRVAPANKDKSLKLAEGFKTDIELVAENYEGNLVSLQQTQDVLRASQLEASSLQENLRTTEKALTTEQKRAGNLESKLGEVTEANTALKTESATANKNYQQEKGSREQYASQVTTYQKDLASKSAELDETRASLALADANAINLSGRASKRVSAIQTLLQTCYGVPESTFKGLAEDKREDFVYKLLEEKTSAKVAEEAAADEEFQEALGLTGKEKTAKNGSSAKAPKTFDGYGKAVGQVRALK